MEKLIEDFIWNGRKPKLKLTLLQIDKTNGGLRLVNLQKCDQALKIQWIFRLHQDDQLLPTLAYYYINTKLHNEEFWQCNFKSTDVDHVCKAQGFGMMWSQLGLILITVHLTQNDVNDI